MKIALFISKSYVSKTAYSSINLTQHYTPIGVLSSAAVLRKAGHEVKLFDSGIQHKYTNKAWAKQLLAFNPDYIGFSTLAFNFDDTYDICSMIKSKLSNIKTVFCGVDFYSSPQMLLSKYPLIDFLIVGDCEYAFRDLADGTLPFKIPGVFSISNEKFTGIEQSQKDLCNLDDLPFPAYDMIENFPKSNRPGLFTYTNKVAVNIITSRGCAFNRLFSNTSINTIKDDNTIRYNSAKYIVDMIEWLYNEYSVRHFEFFDDTFTFDKSRVIDFCNEIKKRNIKISFNCLIKNNFERSLILKLKEAGLYIAYMEIESFDQAILNSNKINLKVKDIKKDLSYLYENNIWCIGLFTVGLPGETEISLQLTTTTIKEVPLKLSIITPFTPYYKSVAYDDLLIYGEFIEDINDLSNFNLEKFVYLPKGISSKKVLLKALKLMRSAHFKSTYYNNIFSKTAKNDIYSYLRIIKSTPYILKTLVTDIFK